VKIIFISHYFPPLNSSGARRIQSFSHYLSSMGHQITVISTKKTRRDGLLTEAIPWQVGLIELNGFGRASSSEIFEAISHYSNGVVPNRSLIGHLLLQFKRAVAKTTGQLVDHRLVFAIQFAYPWLDESVKKALRESDIVMSTSPPWPVHLAGLIVKKRFLKPWVADYRDQFSGSHIQSGSPWFQRREVDLEFWLLKSAKAVITISEPMKEYYQQFHHSVFCIENGYEEKLFEEVIQENAMQLRLKNSPPTELTVRYMGTITADRIPLAFFKALVGVNSKSGLPVIAEFYGESNLLLKAISQIIPEVKPFVRLCHQLPYAAAIRAMYQADALFFIETSNFSSHSSRGVLTTKLFEYLAARKPIIAEISGKALAASYIKRAKAGLVISEDAKEIESALLMLREGKLNSERDDTFIDGLSRRLKAVELERIFGKIVNLSVNQRQA
jgi:glycosyltransferase involved in cell wall biosynthesis